ncbi:MAG TPA: FtsQ-type POTRA domain-containing protein [Oscillospiraceae bacterium]|nr:FtsQ-type POTRA domain-containing protein [Oscillospiraceae bacterium]
MITETHNRGSTRDSTGHMPTQYHREQPPQHRPSGASSRAKKRHRGLMIFYVFTFLMVIVAAVVLSLTVLFKIDTIEVNGTTRYTPQEIISASGIEKGKNLFLTNTSQAGAAIKKKLPYIGTVTVSRGLPAKILITVKSAELSGAVQYNGGYVLISKDGKVLEQVNTLPNDCAAIIGLELASAQTGTSIACKSEAEKALYEELVSVLETNKMDKITKIDISNSYRILVEYDKRITMNLGLASGMDYKIRFAKTVLPQLESNAKGVLNLSVAEEDDRVYFNPNDSTSSTASSSAAASSSKASGTGATSSAGTSSSKVSSSSGTVSSKQITTSSSVSSKKPASSGSKQ